MAVMAAKASKGSTRKTFGAAAGLLLAVGALSLAAPAAHAADDTASSGQKSCVFEHIDDNGNVVRRETVPHGTQVGMLYCRNGEWVFGTLILDVRAPTGSPTATGSPTSALGLTAPLSTLSAQR